VPLQTGAHLGPYEIVAPLGAGGMGEVYRARDGRLGRDVAVKVLPAAFSADPERLHRFEDLTDVQSTLQKLMTREEPLAKVLPRQPGTKESRYAHLLCGEKPEWEAPAPVVEARAESSEDSERLARLEAEVAEMRREIADLKQELAGFRKQFE